MNMNPTRHRSVGTTATERKTAMPTNYPWIIAKAQDMARHAAIAEAMTARGFDVASAYYNSLVRSSMADINAAISPTCDGCGEPGEIRLYRNEPYAPNEPICATCFPKRDAENSFTDFAIVEAAQ